MPLTTPLPPIDYSKINQDFFELNEQVFKRLENGAPVIELILDSEASAIDIEERFNYLAIRRNLPIYFSLSQTRPNVYRVTVDFGELEECA